jgi:hypothetical protein
MIHSRLDFQIGRSDFFSLFFLVHKMHASWNSLGANKKNRDLIEGL